MDLQLRNTELMLAEAARAIFAGVAPSWRQREAGDGAMAYDQTLWALMVEQEWPSIAFSPDAPMTHLGALFTELGRAGIASPLFATVASSLVTGRLATAAHASQLAEDVADGRPAVLVCSAYPTHVSKSTGGNPSVLVSGGPFVVDWAATAEVLVCPVAISQTSCVLCAIVPGTEGLEILPSKSLDNEEVALVTLRDVRIEDSVVLTPDPVPTAALSEALAVVRVLRAASIVGGIQKMLEMTVEYVQERHQFGRALGSFQAVQHMCADVQIHADAAWLATWEAVSRIDAGLPFARQAAIATYVAGRASELAAVHGAQLHGGLGHMAEYPFQLYFRRAKAGRIRLGSTTEQLRDAAVLLLDPVAQGDEHLAMVGD